MPVAGTNESRRPLFNKNETVLVYVPERENSAVSLAVQNLLRDIQSVIGCTAALTDEITSCSIVVGTVANIRDHDLDKPLSMAKLEQADGSLRWEAFLQQAVDGVLYIVGTDRRGTIYGIYDFCEQLGVSPWYYWADVPVKTKEAFVLPPDFCKVDWPSVPYRGIFINDEEELDDWAKLHTPDGTIGPTTYRHLFELLLRLKANYIWPAMHVNYFNGNPENGKLAEQMGIVVGTTHCDMLLRSNQNEWKPWLESKGYTDAIYDYSIEGRNRDILKEYWRESVELNKDNDVNYTMGMRGIHDSGFHTRAIDEDTSLSPDERMDAKVQLLAQVIKDQKQILREVLGEKKEEAALKTFIPYKEVLTLYDRGLVLPDDLTLIWANDNFGHMRRYPNTAERERSGGNGLYFHGSYWAHPGTAMSYLFINSIPLAHTGNELRKSYESGIQKLWIYNIGGLKPVEQDMAFFLQYAWEAGKEGGISQNAFAFTEHWVNANFSGHYGTEVAELYETFAQVTNVRKIEHMSSNVFSQTAYGDEAGRRLQRLEDIFRRGNRILNGLPSAERDAFFQLILMKIHASYYTNHEFYYADRSVLSYERGNMQAADKYAELSAKMLDYKRMMLYFYNKKMSRGKWDGILTPESFPPPPTALYPASKPAIKIAGSGLKVSIWNEEEALRFSVHGLKQKWIELGNQGEGSIPFSISVDESADWITLSETEGTVQTERRILVIVNEPEAHADLQGVITVHDLRNSCVVTVKVTVEQAVPLPEHFAGYVEADGYVSMPAAGFSQSITASESEHSGWLTVPGIGRYEGPAVMAWPSEEQAEPKLEAAPHLAYSFYLKQGGAFILEVYRMLTLDSTGTIRFGIGVDDHPPVVIETDTRDEWLGNWKESIFDNGENQIVELPNLTAGAHVLKLFLIDRFVTISKLVIYTEAKRPTHLGPVISPCKPAPVTEFGLERPEVDWTGLENLSTGFYRTSKEEVPPLNLLYVTREFHSMDDQTFLKCIEWPQPSLGVRRYESFRNSSGPKDVTELFGSGLFMEENGIVAIEAEYALEMSENAFLTTSQDSPNQSWSHLQAETNGRTGFAMHVAEPGILWTDPFAAPGMHYRLKIHTPGVYRCWMLVRHYNNQSDSCYLSLDGKPRPLSEQPRNGDLHEYNTAQVYYWCHMSEFELSEGEHVFSILARKSQLRIDRIYLTLGDELPPLDTYWQDSIRR